MEQVVLLDEHGQAVGVTDKATVHHRATPLHLAFSCYVINPSGEFLLTRRAVSKKTWPGVWTNSCCGHPAPGESLTIAVTRRLRDELDMTPATVELILPAFQYQAVMADGVTENEMCPVVRVIHDGPVHPNPVEVDSYRWIAWSKFTDAVASGALTVSPWRARQVAQLRDLGPDARTWPAATTDALPAAARSHASADRSLEPS